MIQVVLVNNNRGSEMKRNKNYLLALSEEQYNDIKHEADRDSIPMASWIRQALSRRLEEVEWERESRKTQSLR